MDAFERFAKQSSGKGCSLLPLKQLYKMQFFGYSFILRLRLPSASITEMVARYSFTIS